MAKRPVIYGSDGLPMRARMSAFDAASVGRRTANWNASSAGINSILQGSLGTIRSRVRDQVRNIPWVRRASRSYVANIVGTGIRPISKAKDEAFRSQIMELWDDWVSACDVGGQLSFYGLQTLAVRAMRESGEVLIRKLPRHDHRRADLPIPFQLQILEADYLDHTYTTLLDNGGQIVQGVEFNAENERVAYHLFERHPQEIMSGFHGVNRVRVPADEIIHMYELERPGQVRGFPGMVSTVLRMMDMAEYEDAEGMRKKLAAMWVGFITSSFDEDGGSGPNPVGSDGDGYDRDGMPMATLEPGTLQQLDPGQDITFNQPADVGGSYEPYMKMNLRAGAAGSDVLYEHTTGDYAGVTFSSIRAALNDIQRIWEQVQDNILVHQMCRPVWHDFVMWAVKSGAVEMPDDFFSKIRDYLRATWVAPGWPYVNPVDDANADSIRMRNGTESRASIVASRGRDITILDREIAEDNARADSLGLIFDSDPRKTTNNGQNPGSGGAQTRTERDGDKNGKA